MLTGRATFEGIALADGRTLVAGGHVVTPSCDFCPVALAESYDESTGRWTAEAPMDVARGGHALVALPTGGALAISGYDDNLVDTATSERFGH